MDSTSHIRKHFFAGTADQDRNEVKYNYFDSGWIGLSVAEIPTAIHSSDGDIKQYQVEFPDQIHLNTKISDVWPSNITTQSIKK